jgi:hypothetical protein
MRPQCYYTVSLGGNLTESDPLALADHCIISIFLPFTQLSNPTGSRFLLSHIDRNQEARTNKRFVIINHVVRRSEETVVYPDCRQLE